MYPVSLSNKALCKSIALFAGVWDVTKDMRSDIPAHFDCPWFDTVCLASCDLYRAKANKYLIDCDAGDRWTRMVKAYRLSMILTFTPATVSALAHMILAGPAPMINTSMRLSKNMAQIQMVLVTGK